MPKKAKKCREIREFAQLQQDVISDYKRFVLKVLCCGINPTQSIIVFYMKGNLSKLYNISNWINTLAQIFCFFYKKEQKMPG